MRDAQFTNCPVILSSAIFAECENTESLQETSVAGSQIQWEGGRTDIYVSQPLPWLGVLGRLVSCRQDRIDESTQGVYCDSVA